MYSVAPLGGRPRGERDTKHAAQCMPDVVRVSGAGIMLERPQRIQPLPRIAAIRVDCELIEAAIGHETILGPPPAPHIDAGRVAIDGDLVRRPKPSIPQRQSGTSVSPSPLRCA